MEDNNKELAEEIVSKGIQEVAFKYNAFAPIISSFRIAYTSLAQTMGVDRYARLVINPEWVVQNQQYICGILVHEILHVFFGHTDGTREALAYTDDAEHNKIVNIAEDCAINQFIEEALPDGCITPESLAEMLAIPYTSVPYHDRAETYYELIMNRLKEEPSLKQKLQNMCSTDAVNAPASQDELDRMGVEHLSQEEISERTLDTAEGIAKSQGNSYGRLVDFAREMLDPKVDWRPLLQATLRNAEKKVWSIHERNTFKRVSRRSGQILLPKKYGNKISVVLTFDTSGSISQDMVNQFLSEVQNCMRLSDIKECALWHTSNYWYGTPEQLLKDIEKVFQDGGTSESCMGEAEKHCKADLYIHFSDGYHGEDFGFKHPQKHIEIIWDGQDIKEIRKEF